MAAQKNADPAKKRGKVLEILILCLLAVFLVSIFAFGRVPAEGASMLPTLRNQDKLFYVHLFYKPKNGDIVVIDNDDTEKPTIKRVIALAGQELYIDNETGRVSVDGKELDEQIYAEGEELTGDYFVSSPTNVPENYPLTYTAEEYPVTIPEGFVFVMGDNRKSSNDSRYSNVGLIPEDDITGKVLFKYYEKEQQVDMMVGETKGRYTIKSVK